MQPRPNLVHKHQLLPQPLQLDLLLTGAHRPVLFQRRRVPAAGQQRILDADPLRPLAKHDRIDQLWQVDQHAPTDLPDRSRRQFRAKLVDKRRLTHPQRSRGGRLRHPKLVL